MIVCTHNRASLLRGCLHSLVEQSIDLREYEVVVVDNASTDETATVIAEIQACHASHAIVHAREPRLGLAHARNTGLQVARAPIVAFADDDVLLTKHWLACGLELFDSLGESLASVGGPVYPRFLSVPPDWFQDRYETSTLGPNPRFLSHGESFVGGNMMLRRNLIERLGGFSTQLGMSGTSLGVGEETWMFTLLWKQEGAAKLFYSPALYVHHCIPPWKTTVAYCLRRGFAVGQASWTMRPWAPCRPLGWLPLPIRGLLSVFKASGVALLRLFRHRRWQHWAVEELEPVASALGLWTKSMGISIVVRQRPAER